MTWSEQAGVSIVLPSDRVAGDGRNYIVIGEDVPPAIASAFTAALIFRSGAWNSDTDPAVGIALDLTGQLGNLYPIGFVYWAVGITTSGTFEIVCFYVVSVSSTSQSYTGYRRTVLSIAKPPQGPGGPPVTMASGPVISLGTGGAFTEGLDPVLSTTSVDLTANAPITIGSRGASVRKVNGVVRLVFESNWSGTYTVNFTFTTIPVGYRPDKDWFFHAVGYGGAVVPMLISAAGLLQFVGGANTAYSGILMMTTYPAA